MDNRKFRDITGSFATGVTVVTTKNKNHHPVGMTVNAFTSLSLNPPLVLINADKKASLFDVFMEADRFAVNILSSEQEAVSKRFSTKNIDRFEGVHFSEDVTGSPILHNVLAYLDCTVVNHYDGGDHVIVTGETKSGEVREGDPLIFYKGNYVRIHSDLS